jgi:phosphatidate cytidylyltransferase
MSDETPKGRKGFSRPWEEGAEESAEIVPLPGVLDDTPAEPVEEPEAEDLPEASTDIDWEAMANGTGEIEEYTSEEYITATTQEYQGLAEDVSRAAEEEWELQAVAATLPGVESGLVGFEDVSGTVTGSEESYEAIEQAASSDLAMRVGSAIVIFGLFLGSLLLGGWWFSAFVVLLMVVAVGEFYATLRARGHKPLALFGLVGVALMGIGAHNWGVSAIGGWFAFVTTITLLFVSLTPRRNPLEDVSVTVMGVAWVGMLAFAMPFGLGPRPLENVLFIVLLVALNDIGAYFVGRSFGKTRLAPMVSPKKTVEGLVGGLILGAVGASVMTTFPAWEQIGLGRGLVLAAVVGVFSPLGDLVESMVKRSIDVKDMGSVLPGHGGMLDRIDGFLFAVPALYFTFRAFGLL